MKHFKLLAGLFLILAAFSINSCDTEPIDSAINPDDFNQNCEVPTAFIASNFVNGNSVSLNWTPQGDEESWIIEYGFAGFTQGTGTTITATTIPFTITGLNANNSYSFYVKANCGSNASSDWVGPVTVQAMVNPNCANPTGLSGLREVASLTTVDLTWVAGGSESLWQVQYGAAGFALGSGTIVTANTPSKVITGIATSTSYDFYVRSNCSGTENSNWVGPITIQSVVVGDCTLPTNFTGERDATITTDVNLSWVSPATITSFQVQYGVSGFTIGSGITIPSTETTLVVHDIPNPNNYDFYVRANCSDTNSSEWVGPITVNGNVVPNQFFANVDGFEYVENYINAGTITGVSSDNISVYGVKSGSNFLGILIDTTLPEDQYMITGSASDLVKGQYRLNNVDYTATSGSVTIVSKTADRITGTFTFTASYTYTNSNSEVITVTHEVTDGTFDVAY
ncbi:fibronectin type III domain-containing protein [Flavobacterium sp. XGLA_31]|uniref:fibronectin type III domain-containing protein n=1 Tax=Flavobacterium sp. XGLA_31 TaxID=3447666 RepID=UPI003F355E3B